MFTEQQIMLIADAVEDYGVLVDEETYEKCDEILAIIDAYILNKNNQ